MPYLHWTTSKRQAERSQLIKELSAITNYKRPAWEELNKSDEPIKTKLIRAFLFHNPPLHLRKTLDQFYYNTLPDTETDVRNTDQVVYKYAIKHLQQPDRRIPPKIIMVNQLWLWIINGSAH